MTEETQNIVEVQVSGNEFQDTENQEFHKAEEPNIFNQDSDILEDSILKISERLLACLLRDGTKCRKLTKTQKEDYRNWKNIIWASYDYVKYGFNFEDEIKIKHITGKDYGYVIRPRALKNKSVQIQRSKDMAEVFTPAWICNAQNNLIDSQWFGRENVFNTELPNNDWKPTEGNIIFPEGKNWEDYIKDTRLEISCGEAPYIVSRYDATTGEIIELNKRIGLLDRKLRVLNENVADGDEQTWFRMAKIAVQSVYGFEWQGDSLLLARETILYTLMDFFEAKFRKLVLKIENGVKTKDLEMMEDFAYFISWNFWQMDGLKGVIPNSCERKTSPNLFDFDNKGICKACAKDGTYDGHLGDYCYIYEWKDGRKVKSHKFVDLFKKSAK